MEWGSYITMENNSPKVVKWVCGPHALKRIQDRKISSEELAEVIDTPDHTIPQGPKWIFAKRIQHRNDNLIAAVLLEKKEHDLWVVLTVMINFEKK
jgi:hypothetical protein